MSDKSSVAAITDSSFQADVIQSSKPTLVDFWANWCAPCKAIAPMVDELAQSYGDKVNFCKMDIDSNPATPMQFGVKGIPTLIMFKDGQIVDQVVGAVPKGNLEELIKKAL